MEQIILINPFRGTGALINLENEDNVSISFWGPFH